jgi:nitrite reductase (NO-forming)
MIQASKSVLIFAALAVPVLVALLVATATGTPAGPVLTPAAPGDHDMTAMPAVPAGNAAFTLRTGLDGGRMVYIGVGGTIDKVVNPTLQVPAGAAVAITLINGDAGEHDLVVPDFQAASARLRATGAQTTLQFTADKPGTFPYFCTLPGHREAGMEGRLVVGPAATPQVAHAPSIVRDPADLPPPLARRGPQAVEIHLEAVELEGQLASGTTYTYWTFNGQVPGPFLRVRVGDMVTVYLKNRADSHMVHSIDLHAVAGPDGGAGLMQVAPGQEKAFTFKALYPGLFVYHCATPLVASHLASGMFGMILVEPEGGLPPVDREFYVMQSELYTDQPFGTPGRQNLSTDRLLAEQPTYFVFNGAVGALSDQHPLRAQVGQTVRIFFGDAGPNLPSSFHVIGAVFDRVYNLGALESPPLTNVQAVLVPPGGSAMVEFGLHVPGHYMFMDHALSRAERGLKGMLEVTGPDAPDIFRAGGR